MNTQSLYFRSIAMIVGVFTAIMVADAWAIPTPTSTAPPPSFNNASKSGNTEGYISYSEGTMAEAINVADLGGGLNVSLHYRSANADATNFRVDTVMGPGWSHSFNLFVTEYRFDAFVHRGDGSISKFTRNPNGSYTATEGWFETLAKPNANTFVLTDKNGNQYRYEKVSPIPFLLPGPPFYIKSITNSNGLQLRFNYGNDGLLASLNDPYNRTTTFSYGGNKKLLSILNPAGKTALLAYSASNDLLTATDTAGYTTLLQYNANHQITKITNAVGKVFDYVYSNGKPVAVQNLGQTVMRLANSNGWAIDTASALLSAQRYYQPGVTAETDGRGNFLLHEYNKYGYITKETASNGSFKTFAYDPLTLKLATVTDENNHVSQNFYDSRGNLIKERNALGQETLNQYEPVCNHVTQVTHPNGSVTQYLYDSHCNRIKETRDVGGLNLIKEWTYDSQGHVLTETDANGHVTAFEYDSQGNNTKITDAEGNITRFEYDAVGNRTRLIDGNNHATVYTYDGMSRLLTETDPLGYLTEYQYNGKGQRTQVRRQVTLNPAAYQTTQYLYDSRNRPVQEIQDPAGLNLVTQYAYDGNDNPVRVTDPRGKPTLNTYDSQNRLIQVEDALHHFSQTQYDLAGNRICAIDANGHAVFSEYDALNRPVSETRKIGAQSCTVADGDDIVTRIDYDSGASIALADCKNPQCAGPMPGSSSPAHTIDPEGKHSYVKYDPLNRPVMRLRKVGDTADAKDADDWSEIIQYDAAGNVSARYDANGNATTSTYFDNNWLKTEANALGETTRHTYDGVGKPKTTTTPGGNVITNTYNARNELIQVDDSIGRVANHTYDGIGKRLQSCDGNGNCTASAYDAANRLLAVTDAMGQTKQHQYDGNGNLVKTTDREGKAVCHLYDDLNRPIRETHKVFDTDCAVLDGNDVWTETGYDAVGNVTRQAAAKSGAMPAACQSASPPADCETTTYAYDAANRRIQEIHPLRQAGDTAKNTREFAYDKAGNLIQRIDQKNQVAAYSYDDLYRLVLRHYDSGPDDSFTYDVGGRMSSASREGWVVTYAYDAANRVLRTIQNGQIVSYAYDIPNRQRTVGYPGGKSVVERRDLRERLADLNAGNIAVYDYDVGNRVIGRLYGNGTSASYHYDANDWIFSLMQIRPGPAQIMGLSLRYDREGNKVYESQPNPSLYQLIRTEGYGYDDLHRLVDYGTQYSLISVSGGPIVIPDNRSSNYDLDNLGNWNAKTVTGVGLGESQTRAHNAVNEITQINGAPVTSDANGNLTEDATYVYAYDPENRLIQVTRKSDVKLVGQYRYDALSRRVAKIADATQGASVPVETRYIYDDARIIEEQDTAGTTVAAYTYGNGIDEVLSMDRAGQTYYYHQNALGSVLAVTNSNGSIAEGNYDYDAYGVPYTENFVSGFLMRYPMSHSAIGNPWLFTGRQYDEESGLYFYRARSYDANKGRFLQRDPIGMWEDETNLGNGYAYVGNNPVVRVDPLGLEVDSCKNRCIAARETAIWNCSKQCKPSTLHSYIVCLWG